MTIAVRSLVAITRARQLRARAADTRAHPQGAAEPSRASRGALTASKAETVALRSATTSASAPGLAAGSPVLIA